MPVVPHKAVAEVVIVNNGWQGESIDGLKGGWSCFIELVTMAAGRSPHPPLLDVLWCAVAVVVV